ncbi:uncharacterized protein TRIREDRAFT_102970 [Trichoderma reesei QM6a]|uniref:Predicted protein n=2 Tax=Hypocrea jecorina TaxID=51453 RepID=G0R8T1_HYPJQ|nr:uncharacterized protein TRIREDRAFT_102970 [Trichoderma reesei QM6a]EGR52398.1 predicted protein [Trichoderma reesei QM6a]ETS06793.1 hypothetical protein M419DRAFT_126223 [Trichoderma reesei RUT C-30]
MSQKAQSPRGPLQLPDRGQGVCYSIDCAAWLSSTVLGPLSAGRLIGMQLTAIVGFSKKGPVRVLTACQSQSAGAKEAAEPAEREALCLLLLLSSSAGAGGECDANSVIPGTKTPQTTILTENKCLGAASKPTAESRHTHRIASHRQETAAKQLGGRQSSRKMPLAGLGLHNRAALQTGTGSAMTLQRRTLSASAANLLPCWRPPPLTLVPCPWLGIDATRRP